MTFPVLNVSVETTEVDWIPAGRQLSVLWPGAGASDTGDSVASKTELNRNRNGIEFSFRG
jgi:hypothetical protein